LLKYKHKTLIIATIALAACLPLQAANAGGKPFAKIVPALASSLPEGFTIGKGSTAYNGGINGATYKVKLRNGEGEILVLAEPDFDVSVT